MNRKSLCREIQLVNNRLNLTQARFNLVNAQSNLSLKQHNPYLVLGIGLLAGVVTRLIGWQKIYSIANVGINLYPFIINLHGLSDENS